MIRYIVILVLISNVSCKDLGLPAGSPCEWNGIPGICVKFYQCLTAVQDITNRNYPPACSLEGKIPIICCTDCDLVEDTRLIVRNPVLGNLFKTGKRKAKDKCVDYLHTLDYKCKKGLLPLPPPYKMFEIFSNCTYEGNETQRSTDYAVGFGNAVRGDFPHMSYCPVYSASLVDSTAMNRIRALLGFGNTINTAEWLCGGSVISERFILTAAHCVFSRRIGAVHFVALGILKHSDPPTLWQTYDVQRAIRYPGYKPPSKYHDIALLETDREILFSSLVLPACLHVDDNEELIAFGTGWRAFANQNSFSDLLQSVSLRKYTDEECSELYPKHRLLARGFDTSTQMCYEDIATWGGNTGGPLQTLDNKKCVYMILGVSSFGYTDSGVSDGASIYTRVKYYVPWIEDIVWP